MISTSKEVTEWDIEMNLEPDEIEAKVLKRPSIYEVEGDTPSKTPGASKTLDDTSVLR